FQKSFYYIPIVSSVTLWKKGSSHTSPDPRAEKAALPCSRFLTHMKNFSASHKTDKLHFLPFPGPVLRPFSAIGLCRSINQSCSSQQISWRTSLESGQQDKASSLGSWTNTDSLNICGSALGRGLAAITREMTHKHPHRPTEHRSKAASAFRGRAAKEPLPLLVGSSTHLFPKKLMKVCSSAVPRPPRRFHTACSQTLSRPVVTARLH
ncbi:Uncharacterized protein C12orf42, partial [Lemmus lemmus]